MRGIFDYLGRLYWTNIGGAMGILNWQCPWQYRHWRWRLAAAFWYRRRLSALIQAFDRARWEEYLIIFSVLIGPILVELWAFEIGDVHDNIDIGDEDWPRLSNIGIASQRWFHRSIELDERNIWLSWASLLDRYWWSYGYFKLAMSMKISTLAMKIGRGFLI